MRPRADGPYGSWSRKAREAAGTIFEAGERREERLGPREARDGDARRARQVGGVDREAGGVADAEDARRGVVDGHAGSVARRELAGARGVGLLGLRDDEEVGAREGREGLAQAPGRQERAAGVGRRRVEEDDVEVAREGDVREAVVEEVEGRRGRQRSRAARRGPRAPAVGHDRDGRKGAGEERRLVAGVAHGREGARAVRDDDRPAALAPVAARENRRA